MPQAAGTAVDHHAHAAELEAETGRDGLVGDGSHDLDLQEVVPGAEATDLEKAALPGPRAHRLGVCTAEDPTVLAALEVAVHAVPSLHSETGTTRKDGEQLIRAGEMPDASSAEPREGCRDRAGPSGEPAAAPQRFGRGPIPGGAPRRRCRSRPLRGRSTPPSATSVAAMPPMGKPYPQWMSGIA